MLKYYFALFLLLGLFVISCSSSIPAPTQEQIQWASSKWPGTGAKELSEDRDLYIAKCSGCHSLKVPSDYTEEEWKPILNKMGKKAKLNESEYEMIRQYVSTLSKK